MIDRLLCRLYPSVVRNEILIGVPPTLKPGMGLALTTGLDGIAKMHLILAVTSNSFSTLVTVQELRGFRLTWWLFKWTMQLWLVEHWSLRDAFNVGMRRPSSSRSEPEELRPTTQPKR